MKFQIALLAVTTALFAQTVGAEVIYGEDNRVEVFEATSFQQIKAKSAATMMARSSIISKNKTAVVEIEQVTLRQSLERTLRSQENSTFFSRLLGKKESKMTFCKEEPFVDQPKPGVCSGFLIAPDLVLTAGHCTDIKNACSDYQWVFDFSLDEKSQTAGKKFDSKNIYSCKKVINSSLIRGLNVDFGLIQLDRVVEGRVPLEVRTSGKIKKGEPLFVIGSPSGLPLKVADNAQVRASTHPLYFTSNLDTYAGNSGSAVFNEVTGAVEGILVRGDTDYVPNNLKGCVESNRCSDTGCDGESVTKILALPEIGVYETLEQAIGAGDLDQVKNIFKLNIWVDFYLADGQSALMKAAKANQGEILKFLLNKGANRDLKDTEGKSAMNHAEEHNSREVIDILKNI